MKPEMKYLDQTRQMVCETLMIDSVDSNQDLFETGLMDSLALVNLIMNIEDTFQITVPAEDLDIEDYRSVESIAQLVARLQMIKA
jgi:D-alanine--poly(phosphoribitol) ligase subunit 2